MFEKVNLKKSTDDKKGREELLNMQRNDLFLFNLQFLFMLLSALNGIPITYRDYKMMSHFIPWIIMSLCPD